LAESTCSSAGRQKEMNRGQNHLRRGLVNNERHVVIIWLSVLAAITLLTGSTLAQIPERSDAD